MKEQPLDPYVQPYDFLLSMVIPLICSCLYHLVSFMLPR